MNKIAVKDAHVFIDLESMGILDLWFQLGYETITSSFIVDELREGAHHQSLAYIESGHILNEVLELIDFYPLYEELEESGLSAADVSVLYLAQQRQALLLTGDGRLRTESSVRRVEYHGSLWILEQLVAEGILEPLIAAQKLEHLQSLTGQDRRYLPSEICANLI